MNGFAQNMALLDQRRGNGNIIAVGPSASDHYNTVYGDTFQDPKNTLGYGAKSKAEKLKKAAMERGTPVPPMVQFETFDDAVTERVSETPEHGLGRLLPSKKEIRKDDQFNTVAQEGYGPNQRRTALEAKLASSGELPPAVGRSGTRVERGKGITTNFKTNASNPQENTLVQMAWTYGIDPALKVKLQYNGGRPQMEPVDGLSLPIGEEAYGSRDSIKDRASFARVATITKQKDTRESSLRHGRHIWMDCDG